MVFGGNATFDSGKPLGLFGFAHGMLVGGCVAFGWGGDGVVDVEGSTKPVKTFRGQNFNTKFESSAYR